MSVWFTSDLHIGHRLVAEHRAHKVGAHNLAQVDTVIEWHDELLAANWDTTVRKDDHVWIVGDISSGSSSAQTNALLWLSERPGIKHLIYGNHDGPHPLNRDSEKWLPTYRNVFASRLQMAARRRIPLAEGGHTDALLSHFPYHADREGTEPRYTQWRLRDEDAYLIHGHTHSETRFNGKEIHIGADAWDYSPVPLETIVTYIQEREASTHG